MFSGVSEPGSPCCAACAGTPLQASSSPPAPAPRWKLLAVVAGLAGLAGTAFYLWDKKKPPRYYQDPTNDDEDTRDIPREWMKEVVDERR